MGLFVNVKVNMNEGLGLGLSYFDQKWPTGEGA
jgi:hypothetical protein